MNAARFVDLDLVARDLGVSEEWVRRQVRAGRFPHHRVARRIRFTDADVAEILATMAVPAAPPAATLAAVPTPAPTAVRRYAVYPGGGGDDPPPAPRAATR